MVKQGSLHVRVLEGQDIKSEDIIGQGDPYVEFWINPSKKSKTEVRNNTKSPVWLKEEYLHVNNDPYLHIKLQDKDILTSDEIGEVLVDLAPVYQNFYQDTWVSVKQPGKEDTVGKIHLILEFFPGGH